MKAIKEQSKHLRAQLLDWVLIKGPQLFIALYGK